MRTKLSLWATSAEEAQLSLAVGYFTIFNPTICYLKSPTTNEKQKPTNDITYKLKNAQNENMGEIICKRSGLKDINKKIAMARASQKAFQAFRTQTTLPNRSNLHR
ncbi:hypothetical protein [Helicobacter pylori]|uniref:hypothetical protein n=1 Tax=Helicobacter pylori TaxID=210 RepID=UPI0013F4A720|nr:hypothetical protein [Helicobacter pylori]